MRTRTIHMVGNEHIDPVWLWTAAEGRQETLDTCRSALEMDETDRKSTRLNSSHQIIYHNTDELERIVGLMDPSTSRFGEFE